MSYATSAEPIKLGFLYDFKLPEGDDAEQSRQSRELFLRPFEMISAKGASAG